jgi:ribosomal-protein-alanine N-acetyltransferase
MQSATKTKPKASAPVLETERLVLRPLSPDDLPAMHLIFNDPEVGRHLFDGELVPFKTTVSILDASDRDFSERGVGLFGVRLRGAHHDLVGLCGLRWEEEIGEMEIMYCLLPQLWGRGLTTEAARAALSFAFEEAGLRRVMGGADESNAAFLRVIEKLGMRPVGRVLAKAPEVPYLVLERDGISSASASGGRGVVPVGPVDPTRREREEEARM